MTFSEKIHSLLLGRLTRTKMLYRSVQLLFFPRDKRFDAMRGTHEGEQCFIVGLGPSLTTEDLDRLADNNVFSFSVNRCYQLFDKTRWRPKVYFVSDKVACYPATMDAIRRMLEEGVNVVYNGISIKNMPKNAVYYRPYVNDRQLLSSHNEKLRRKGHRCRMSLDAGKFVYDGTSCVHSLIQIAYYMGFKQIYLLGVDCGSSTTNSYCVGIENANSGIYLKGEADPMLLDFESLKNDMIAKHVGCQVLNCTRGGRLESFPRVSFDQILG